MPSSLKSKELSQWTHGNPDLIAKLLFNLFSFLQLETNKGKDPNLAYKKAAENIGNFISLLGDQRLHIPQPGKASVDGSALLGAYLRLGVTLNDKPIVELSEEQIEAVHTFVKPLIPEGFTPKQFFDGIEGSPSKKHAAILKLLIFKGISPEHKDEMFKGKYAEKVNTLLDSVLNLVDFMRTPFSVLVLEEKAAVAAAKKLGKENAQTSGIDLQWTSMYKAIERSLQDIINLKKGSAEKAEKFLQEIKPSLTQCQQCFGIANTRYEVQKEYAAETKKREEDLSETFKSLGFPDGNPAKIAHYISEFRQSLIGKEPEKAEAIKIMTLKQLINTYAAQWQAALDKIKRDLASSKEEVQKTKDTLQQKESALFESDNQLQSLRLQYETLKLKSDEAGREFERQSSELARLKKVESTSKQTIKELELAIQTTQKDQQINTTLEQLEKQLRIAKKENEQLRSKVSLAQKHEQTLLELQKQLEDLRKDNESLHRQLEAKKQTTKPTSEVPSEVSQLKAQLESLHRENDSLRQTSPEVDKRSKASSSGVQSEVSMLRSQLKLLRIENNKLREELSNVKPPLPKLVPKLPDLGIKADLLIALGELRLNKGDRIRMRDTIIASKEEKQLSDIGTEIKRLQKINEFIETINKGILERAGFFSSDPYKKTKAIETAFQELSVDDKYKLATLSEEKINEELSKENGEETDIGKFLKAIHHKRGFIAIHQATSFTFFKSNIGNLDKELQHINSPIQVL
ncbi:MULTISPECIES: hypothetical protein [Legionella]|uniref:Chromosome partition protein Smc n=1 Tax=Legionella resiliens TaxID=2905958 RepID=A0ABS8X640_9GAMM|nr:MULTISPECIES: hypothetical protein [unclassified Legionella]MCE0724285.1 hypothetical protein [Legionella sp. 9fVS26]MCE3533437.1 hypothetical protein [Legionella sp. 8cVS16]QLZ69622.1 hypothetical protein FOLKNPGA_02416 [Legionella sp. PC1000]